MTHLPGGLTVRGSWARKCVSGHQPILHAGAQVDPPAGYRVDHAKSSLLADKSFFVAGRLSRAGELRRKCSAQRETSQIKSRTAPRHPSMIPPAHLVGTAAVTENLLKRRWSAVILRHLALGRTNPEQITEIEPDLSHKALNERLRNLQRFCLIARYPRPAPSQVVEYRLTARGHEILKLLNYIEQLDREVSEAGGNGAESGSPNSPQLSAEFQAKKRLIIEDQVKPKSQPPTQRAKSRAISP